MTELEQVYKRNEDFVFRRIEGETILVPIRGNVSDLDCIYSLNPIGALIWERLDGSADLKAIRGTITSEYDVGKRKAEADLLEFIRDMKAIGAVAAVERRIEGGNNGRKTKKERIR